MRTFLIGQRILLIGLSVLQIGLIECGDALEDGLLSLLSGHIYIRKREIGRNRVSGERGRESQLILLAKNNFYNTDPFCTLLTLSGGQDDLLLSGGILQFLRVETLQLALQILGHLGQILECWCWCCWGCHLQEIERKKEIKSNLKENKNKLRISCIFPLHLSITTQSPNNKNPDIDSGLRAITAVELVSIKRKCASITQRNAACSTYSHTRTRIMHVCVEQHFALFTVLSLFLAISHGDY